MRRAAREAMLRTCRLTLVHAVAPPIPPGPLPKCVRSCANARNAMRGPSSTTRSGSSKTRPRMASPPKSVGDWDLRSPAQTVLMPIA
nr:hypothetical protein [Mycobacterium nebraskense]